VPINEKQVAIREFIEATLRTFNPEGLAYEIRGLRKRGGGQSRIWKGINSFRGAAHVAANSNDLGSNLYLVLNPIDYSEVARKKKEKKSKSTTDLEVTELRWLPIDVDPVRPAGCMATDAEVAIACGVLGAVRAELESVGIINPVVGSSGNGGHNCFPILLPNDEDGPALIKQALQILSVKFSNDNARVDTSVYNPSRIWRLYGTMNRKGDSTAERPHRLSRLIEAKPWDRQIAERNTEALRRYVAANAATLEQFQEVAQKNDSPTVRDKNCGTARHHARDSSVEERARAYLSRIPGGVSGNYGSRPTFYAACVLVQDFDLSPVAAFPILDEWSQQTCVPPWSEAELWHKLRGADAKTGPRGRLLNATREPSQEWLDKMAAEMEEANALAERQRGYTWTGRPRDEASRLTVTCDAPDATHDHADASASCRVPHPGVRVPADAIPGHGNDGASLVTAFATLPSAPPSQFDDLRAPPTPFELAERERDRIALEAQNVVDRAFHAELKDIAKRTACRHPKEMMMKCKENHQPWQLNARCGGWNEIPGCGSFHREKRKAQIKLRIEQSERAGADKFYEAEFPDEEKGKVKKRMRDADGPGVCRKGNFRIIDGTHYVVANYPFVGCNPEPLTAKQVNDKLNYRLFLYTGTGNPFFSSHSWALPKDPDEKTGKHERYGKRAKMTEETFHDILKAHDAKEVHVPVRTKSGRVVSRRRFERAGGWTKELSENFLWCMTMGECFPPVQVTIVKTGRDGPLGNFFALDIDALESEQPYCLSP
jgi:hypothetical protein